VHPRSQRLCKSLLVTFPRQNLNQELAKKMKKNKIRKRIKSKKTSLQTKIYPGETLKTLAQKKNM
jgi:hypothetical protein